MVDHSLGKDLPSVSIESFEYFPGRGLTATVNGIEVLYSVIVSIPMVPYSHLLFKQYPSTNNILTLPNPKTV